MKPYRRDTSKPYVATTCPVAKRFLSSGDEPQGAFGLRRPNTLRPPQKFLMDAGSLMRRSQTAPLVAAGGELGEVDPETIHEFEHAYAESCSRTSMTQTKTTSTTSEFRHASGTSRTSGNSNGCSRDLENNNNCYSSLPVATTAIARCAGTSSPTTSPVRASPAPRLNRNKKDLKLYTGNGFSLSQPCLPIKDNGPTRIFDYLYLGSQQDALSKETLEKYNIKYVLNVSCGPKSDCIDDSKFMRIKVNDTCHDKLLPHFHEAFEFIDKAKEAREVVLVHCLAGISRSPTLAIAYVMRSKNTSYEDAYRFVKRKRPCIEPNFNFLGQLLEFQELLQADQ